MSIGLGLLVASWDGLWSRQRRRAGLLPDMRRAVARWPSLLPESDSPEAIKAWAAGLGDDVSEDDIVTLRELLDRAGRRHTDATDTTPAIEAPSIDDAVVPVEVDATTSPRQALEPREAAGVFLRWLRANNHTGPVLADQLSALYASHCDELLLQPLFYATLRKHLIKLPGVDRRIIDISASSRDGKRQRPRVWYFGESVSDEESDAPWSDLPMRAA